MAESLDDTPVTLTEDAANMDNSSYIDLRNAMSQLSEKYRRPLELFYFADLSAEEIARILGISPNAVRIRLSRGRTVLKNMLE